MVNILLKLLKKKARNMEWGRRHWELSVNEYMRLLVIGQ